MSLCVAKLELYGLYINVFQNFVDLEFQCALICTQKKSIEIQASSCSVCAQLGESSENFGCFSLIEKHLMKLIKMYQS